MPLAHSDIGRRLLGLREQLNLSQEDVAMASQSEGKRVRFDAHSLSSWERGVSFPTAPRLAFLCRHYGASADSLLGLEEPSLADKVAQQVRDLLAGVQRVEQQLRRT
jgi:transcriptional regulator with XRE-family HTH domain